MGGEEEKAKKEQKKEDNGEGTGIWEGKKVTSLEKNLYPASHNASKSLKIYSRTE